MAFPTPTIYYYRVVQVGDPGRTKTVDYTAEFSADGGVTYFPAFSQRFQSLDEANNAIATLISEEVQFQDIVDGDLTVPGQLVPTVTVHAYPPA